MMNRADRSGFAAWWWTVDRVALTAMFALVALGLMLAIAASPAATGGPFTEGDFRFAVKQIAFAAIAVVLLMFTSMLSLQAIKVSAIIIYGFALLGSFAVLFTSGTVLGAKRWIDLGLFTLQPSEFLKPSFAIIAASILAERVPLKWPKELIAFAVAAPALLILIRQPDLGQTALLIALWGTLLFFNGARFTFVAGLAAASAVLLVLAYFSFSYVHHRIDQFLDPHKMGYQAELALRAFAHGGLAGVGPGAGTVKYHLPDAHSDFIFAVAGEEFGIALCGTIALLFCLLCVRILLRAARMNDDFSRLAGAGLAVVVALQAFINMSVALELMPTKGMTLPFISYGGSSLFAVALTMGFALAATRQRSRIGERDVELFGFLKEAPA